MNFDLNEEQKEIQRAADEFVKGEFDKDVALELDRNHQYPFDILKKACKLGFIGTGLQTSAAKDERGYAINGVKTFISNGRIADPYSIGPTELGGEI